MLRNVNRNTRKRRARRQQRRLALPSPNQQLASTEMYLVDYLEAFGWGTSYAGSLANSITSSTDFTNLKDDWGEMRFHAFTFSYMPFMTSPVNATDCANGVFAIKQGPYIATPLGITTLAALRIPGSRLVNKMIPFTYTVKILGCPWLQTTALASQSSMFPCLTYYLSPYGTDSTNQSSGLWRVSVAVSVRCKLT